MKKIIHMCAVIVACMSVGMQARLVIIYTQSIDSLKVKKINIPEGQKNLLGNKNSSTEYDIGEIAVYKDIRLDNVTPTSFTLQFKTPGLFPFTKGKSFEVAVPAGTKDIAIEVDSHGLKSIGPARL